MSWQKTFVNIQLTAEDRPRLESFDKQYGNDTTKHLMDLTGSGYKISMRWVEEKQSFCVTLIGHKSMKRNQNFSMSSFSDDLHEAIVMANYKDAMICDGGEWDKHAQDSNWG